MSATSPTAASAVDAQANCWLIEMPLEVIVRITHSISTVDLGNVRLTCKALEQAVFNFFSHEFFRKKQFMATTDSLQALIDISKHPTLSRSLKHVILSTDRPTRDQWVNDKNDEFRARLELAVADHLNLLATGRLRDMLADAFANLTNLETVDIRDFNSRSRNRDGVGCQWRSYGAVALETSTRTAVRATPWIDQDPYPSNLFGAATAALVAAQARPKSIEVLFRGMSYSGFALHDTAFYIPPQMESSMSSLLAGLQTLHLSLALSWSRRMRPFMTQKFISLAPNLTWLRLNFTHTGKEEAEDVLSWLALKDIPQSPAAPFDQPPTELRHLERLDLGITEIEPSILLKLAAKFAPTLTSLYLRRVTMCNRSNFNHRSETKINPWAVALTALSRLPGLNLRVLDLSSIATTSVGMRVAVAFKVSEASKPSYNWRCSTNLVTMDKAIAQAVDAMAVAWPQTPDTSSLDEDSSEEEDDDEDEAEDEADEDGGGEADEEAGGDGNGAD